MYFYGSEEEIDLEAAGEREFLDYRYLYFVSVKMKE